MARFVERQTGPLFCLYRIAGRHLKIGVRYQPNRDYVSNDDIQTPPALARQLVAHFSPAGRILEPCAGDGHILDCLPPGADWCEIKRGRDFLQHTGGYDWIITNPPWSQLRVFLKHAFALADNVVFLMTVNHAWTKARLRDMYAAGFGLCQIHLVPTPLSFPPSGFQLGAIHYKRGHEHSLKLTHASCLQEAKAQQMAARAGIEPATK